MSSPPLRTGNFIDFIFCECTSDAHLLLACERAPKLSLVELYLKERIWIHSHLLIIPPTLFKDAPLTVHLPHSTESHTSCGNRKNRKPCSKRASPQDPSQTNMHATQLTQHGANNEERAQTRRVGGASKGTILLSDFRRDFHGRHAATTSIQRASTWELSFKPSGEWAWT